MATLPDANAVSALPRIGVARTKDRVGIAYRQTAPRHDDVPRVVFVHSLALDSSVWDGVVQRLAPIAKIVAIDCRGHGRSERAPGPYTIEMFGDDVAAVLDHVGWRDVVAVGCSMGGCVVQSFAGRHPDRVNGLVLVDTTAWYGATAPTDWRARAATARADGLAGMAAFQATRWFGDRFREEHPDLVQSAMEIFSANDLDCYAATCAMLGDADLRPYLGDFGFPVSVIVGEDDFATPVAMAEYLRDSIPGATLQVLAKGRHLTPIECPDAIAENVLAHVARTRASPAGT
jgi:3-oxoadipate enol-lactonase